MSAANNPAFEAFLRALRDEMVFCQVVIARSGQGFSLRHVESAGAALRAIAIVDLRALAQFTEEGAFRPLKSAPNLARSWQAEARNAEELWLALNSLYPGAVADWFAAQAAPPPITSYRDFTARQTGMYRITATLADEPARAAIAACCHQDFCLKRRLWTHDGLPPDGVAEKSAIPCLEPCAVLLEFARKVARWEQGVDPVAAAPMPGEPAQECDFDAPDNPRRLRFNLEKKRRVATISA
jgi:hypothetical protein